MNSREKGKRGERQWRDELRANGYAARRGQQFSGSVESPDVVSPALPWLHFEVKRCERVDLRSWCAQAEGDCGGKPWVVALRWNDGPWLFVGLGLASMDWLGGGFRLWVLARHVVPAPSLKGCLLAGGMGAPQNPAG